MEKIKKVFTEELSKWNKHQQKNEGTINFKIKIGEVFKDDKRDIIILDRKYMKDKDGVNRKWYKYKCNKCGFESSEHYKNGEYKEELWVVEYSLLNGGGCSCCAGKIVVPGINDLITTNPEMIKYFINPDDAKLYSHSSNKEILVKCPDCGKIKNKPIKINDIYNQGIGCICSDKIPYPEKFMVSVFDQLNIKFISQLTRKVFKWCNDYKYDFYFELNNIKYIVETHGIQHYDNSFYTIKSNKKTKTVKEEQENDRLKKELALANRIKKENYIVIDCRKSELEWIRDNENGILNSRLNELFDLSRVDWVEVEKFALSNLVKKACEIKRDNPDFTTTEIGEIMHLTNVTIIDYLKKGTKLGWCNYNPKEEIRRNYNKNGSRNKERNKPVEIFKDGKSLGIYLSAAELERKSEEDFGVKLSSCGISEVCNIDSKKHRENYKGYIFKFVN